MTLTPAKTGRDGTTDLLPFVTSSFFYDFRDFLKQKEEIFQNVPKRKRSRELSQIYTQKNLSDLTGKIEGKSGLATTCHFLLKYFTFSSVFSETFTSERKSTKRPAMEEKKMKQERERTESGTKKKKSQAFSFFSRLKTISKFCFVCMPETKVELLDPAWKGSLVFTLQTFWTVC